jgi:hypothetical protein
MEHNNGFDDAVRESRGRLLASLVGLVVLTLATASFVRLPGRTVLVGFLGSEVSYRFSGAAQYTLLLAGMVCAGLVAVWRAGQKRQAVSLLTAATFWGLPLHIVLSGLLLLDTLSWWGYQIGLAVLVGAVIATVITLQMRSAAQPLGPARLALNGITYAIALLAFAAIYAARWRSLLSATTVLMASTLLSAELFRDTDTPTWQVWLWSGLVGLLLSEMTWALNYTQLNTRAGAVLLLTGFYVLSGIIQQHLWQRLSRRAVIEFGAALAGGILVALVLS